MAEAAAVFLCIGDILFYFCTAFVAYAVIVGVCMPGFIDNSCLGDSAFRAFAFFLALVRA